MKSQVPLLKKKRPTVKEAILIWLVLSDAVSVKSSHMEVNFKAFLKSRYGKHASASNISRRWRELKGEDGLLTVKESGRSPEGEWLLIRFSTDSWDEWKTKQRSFTHG